MADSIAIAIAVKALERIKALTRTDSGPWLAADDALQTIKPFVSTGIEGIAIAATALERVKQLTRTGSGPWLAADDALQKIQPPSLDVQHPVA